MTPRNIVDTQNLTLKGKRGLFGDHEISQKDNENRSYEVHLMVSNQVVSSDWTKRTKTASTEGSSISIQANSNAMVLTKMLVKDVFSLLRSALKAADLWDSLDYFKISKVMQKRQDALFPSFEWISCAPVTSGGNHYVYIGTIYKGRHNLIFVGKTLKGFDKVCEVANKCARELGA